MNEVELLENIFKCQEKDLLMFLKEKQNWINNIFYIGGYESDLTDDILNNLLDGKLIFKNCFFNDENFSEEECLKINELTEGLAVLDLSNNRDYECDFFIQLNFNKMEKSMYQDLYPNFYHKISYKDLKIKKDMINSDIIDIFKCLIIGIKDESRIIISKDRLDKMTYFCPVISKVFYNKNISPDALIKLGRLAHKNHVELEEYDGK